MADDLLRELQETNERLTSVGKLARGFVDQVRDLQVERIENLAEIHRHHRDFSRISAIVGEVLNDDRDEAVVSRMRLLALRQIRDIVG